jgi:hypothetical protein
MEFSEEEFSEDEFSEDGIFGRFFKNEIFGRFYEFYGYIKIRNKILKLLINFLLGFIV